MMLTAGARIEDLPLRDLAIDLVVDCTGVFKTAAKVAPTSTPGCAKVVVSAPIKDAAALNLVYGVNHRPLRPGPPPPGHRGELHDQLPRAGGQGAARDDRHPARLDHDHPRRDQHPGDRGPAGQGPAPRPVRAQLADPDHDRLGDGDHADLPRARRPAERPRGAGAAAERVAHRLRVRDGAADHGRGGERPLRAAGPTGRSRASSASRPGRSSPPTSSTTRARPSSTGRRPWSSTARR